MNTNPYQKPVGYSACLLSYIFYLIGPLTLGIIWLAGLIVAITSKTDAAPEIKEHLDYAKRLGVSGLVSYIIIIVVTYLLSVALSNFYWSCYPFCFIFVFGLGFVKFITWIPLIIWWIWSIVKTVRGLNALTSGTDAPA